MSATIIAEALAAAERETPRIGSPEIFCVLFDSGNTHWTDDVPDGLTSGVGNEETCVHVRSDFFLAALKHLAERLERAEAEAADFLRIHEKSKSCLIAKAIEVADSWSGGSDSLAERLRDELDAIDFDDIAMGAIAYEDEASSTSCTCEYGCPHGDGCRYVSAREAKP